MKNPYIFLLLIIFIVTCNHRKVETNSLGVISMQITGNAEAQDHFEKGLLYLHSFEYNDAREEFILAQEADANCTMAYWGEAMTHNHPLWSQQYYEKGQAVLLKLGENMNERKVKANTAFEKDLLKGVEILFGEGSKVERDDQYADHMERLSKKYPESHEVSAFYALSLLGSVEEGRDYEVYGKGANIAKGILEENPSHPGALHYLIHAYDDPDHATLAIEAANNYSKVAPDAGHALHMPSHIYIAMGMWDAVINSNIDSYNARLKKIETGKSNVRNLHAYHWLMYGYLQSGDYDEATTILKDMSQYIKINNSTYARYYMIEMLGNYMAETGDWNGQFKDIRVETEDLNIQSKASQLFIDGYLAYLDNDEDRLNQQISILDEEIEKASNQLLSKGVTVCSGVSFASRTPTTNDVDISRVLLTELQFHKALLNNDHILAEEIIREAVSLEDGISFSFGPPSIVFPTYELYGRKLLEQKKYDEAREMFDRSLKKGPGRRTALLGKLEAARGLNDQELISELEEKLKLPQVNS